MSTYLTAFSVSKHTASSPYPFNVSVQLYSQHEISQSMILVNSPHLRVCILKQRNQHVTKLRIHAPNPHRKQRPRQNSSWACWLSIQPAIAFCDHTCPISYLNLASISPTTCCLIKDSSHIASLRRQQLTKCPSTSMLLSLIFTVLHNICFRKFSKYY